MRTLALVAFIVITAAPATAQELTVPRIEAGPDVSWFQIQYLETKTGGGGHVAIAVTPWLAIDTQVRIFPSNATPYLNDGGTTVQLFAGARALFLSRGRWTVYGLLLPGVVHFTNAITDAHADPFVTGGSTHAALDMGADVAFHMTRRWDAHVNWTGPLYTVRGFKDPPEPPPGGGPYLEFFVPARIESTFHVSAGVSYRAGSLQGRLEPSTRGAWQVGGEIGSATFSPMVSNSIDPARATRVGGFASIPITTWMDADGSANVYLRYDRSYSSVEGGRIAQLLAGVKVGRRVGRVGYFGKFRAGTQTHSDVVPEGVDFRRENFRRGWQPAIEIGMVIETTIHRRLTWRFDAGDVMTFFPSDFPEPAAHTLALTTGLGWRFGSR